MIVQKIFFVVSLNLISHVQDYFHGLTEQQFQEYCAICQHYTIKKFSNYNRVLNWLYWPGFSPAASHSLMTSRTTNAHSCTSHRSSFWETLTPTKTGKPTIQLWSSSGRRCRTTISFSSWLGHTPNGGNTFYGSHTHVSMSNFLD